MTRRKPSNTGKPGKPGKPGTDQKAWVAVLSELRTPLTFFGLCLLVTESAFSAPLYVSSFSETLRIVFGSFMVFCFTLAMSLVAYLTYSVPKHLNQLPAQESKNQNLRVATMEVAKFAARKAPSPDDAIALISTVTGLLAEEER